MGKKGRLYLKFVVAVALLALTIYSLSVFASLPSSQPRISSNFSSLNLTVGFANTNLFGHANFSAENGSFEENSTFKWLKRTLYQPQNSSLVGYWKLDGNANDSSQFGNHGTIVDATPNQSHGWMVVENAVIG